MVVEELKKSGDHSGDYVWQLPLTNDYRAAVKSDVADLCNIGKKDVLAGTITAAAFLEPFAGETPWSHIDIAGTAFGVPHVSYLRSGSATGAGVRLLVDWVVQRAKV